jgi:hypothetical protein
MDVKNLLYLAEEDMINEVVLAFHIKRVFGIKNQEDTLKDVLDNNYLLIFIEQDKYSIIANDKNIKKCNNVCQ